MGGKKKAAKEKPLEKMTAKELREVAIELSEITGAHGMNKTELIQAIRKAKGIEDTGGKQKDSGTVRAVKKKIRETKGKQQAALESEDSKMAAIYRRRISRLKKRARRAA